ncbi:MAG: methionine adenosyltransferase [Candidatus Bathyarchaeia archaeon]|jgi:S-adenosylmethionine synthetase
MGDISVNLFNQTPVQDQPIEICERKGLGHPDSICDSMMDRISVALCEEYLKRFGRIMHHNIDKGLLVAGEVETKLRGGRVVKPMLMVFGDRATFVVGGDTVPVEDIVKRTAKEWFKQNLHMVDPDKHLEYQIELKRGSDALTDIFNRKSKYLGANDTSAAVGFAPMTTTERIVLETEKFLNSADFKKQHPDTGEDIKIMGMRKNRHIDLTIAIAFVDRYVDSEQRYFKRKEEIKQEVLDFVHANAQIDSIDVNINTADVPGRGLPGMYLTVLGTSADGADCGQVGRGNRVNGIIPLNRPTCSEAAAGKNPTSHVGKIYNFLTYEIAKRVQSETNGVREVYVWLLSEIGRPINEPKIASVQLILDHGTTLKEVSSKVQDLVAAELSNIDKFSDELAHGRMPVC